MLKSEEYLRTLKILNRGLDKVDIQEVHYAIQALEHISETDSDNAEILENLGLCYAFIKDYEKAIEYFMEALERNPNAQLIWLEIRKAYLAMGQSDKAKMVYERAYYGNRFKL